MSGSMIETVMNEALRQQQFLNVIDRDEADRRFRAVLDLSPLESEMVPLDRAWGRVLAHDMIASVDVPGFDRSNVDGFAVRAEDTFGAAEDQPRVLRLQDEILATGTVPRCSIEPGTATPIATGAMLPRGADAVIMIEHTDLRDEGLRLSRPVAPGENITFTGTDVGRGETVVRQGTVLGSRDTGVLAAVGCHLLPVVRQPRVAILSTGDELRAPGAALGPASIFDSNATTLADAVREQGGLPEIRGIIPDDYALLEEAVRGALDCDMVLLSGGTSKGAGDISYRVVERLGPPGVVAHGVALKPGKPLCLAALAVQDRRPVPIAVLPGFPTSAVFTFHEFLAPVVRCLAGRRDDSSPCVRAILPHRVNSERGRTEYLLVSLVTSDRPDRPPAAYPLGKGSGSVTTFAHADGFITIPRQREYLDAHEIVDVQPLKRDPVPADLVIIGSHCIGVDFLLGELHRQGISSKYLSVGSTGGLEAAKRGECDLAGIHLLDPVSDQYNRPFLTDDLVLVPGYRRLQGVVFRPGDSRFTNRELAEAVAAALADPECVMVNRNRGSGTRILIDRLLGTARPRGYLTESRSHVAVAAAVAQGRADWGVSIEPVARSSALGFIPLREEQYDFVIPKSRRARPAVEAFVQAITNPDICAGLTRLGFTPAST